MNPKENGRGLLTYIRDDLKYNLISEESITEIQQLEIKLAGSTLTVVNMYRSPRSCDENNAKINEYLKNIGRSRKKFIVGDFNYPDIDWEVARATGEAESNEWRFLEAVKDSFMEQHVKTPTRSARNNRPSLLDLMLTHSSLEPKRIDHCAPLGKGDHVMTKTSFALTVGTDIKYRRNYRKSNFKAIRKYLKSKLDTNSTVTQNVNEKWEFFRDTIQTAVENHVPLTKITRGEKSRLPLDSATREAIKQKKKTWKQFIKENSDWSYREYARRRNMVRKLTRKRQHEKEQTVAAVCKSNPKAFWSFVNQKTKTRETIPDLEREDGNTTSCDYEKAETLSTFFASVFVHEEEPDWDIAVTNRDQIDDNINISTSEVLEQLKKLDDTKSPGYDGIHARVLLEAREKIAEYLTEIFNESWRTGTVPDDWRRANISAIYKKGPKKDAANYRTVSLTSVCCKVMEKFVRKHLMNHILTNDLISQKQYEFMTGRSTTLQLLRAMNDWTEALDKNNEVDIIYLDFKKAFDTVPHQRLFRVLHQLGIGGKTHDWIRSFLNGREQRVMVNEIPSRWEPVLSGIPQGLVLGPVLFIIYINSMTDVVQSPLLLFADDATLYREISTVEDQLVLQKDLEELRTWSKTSLLEFNAEKCVKMTLTSKKKTTSERTYNLNKDQNLKSVYKEKDLGIMTDSKRSFEEHICMKLKKANSILALIRRSFINISKQVFLQLYKALIRPHLEYANQIWYPNLKKHKTSIENVQRRATRLVGSLRGLSFEERLRELKLPTTEYRRQRGRMIEIFKIINGMYDESATGNLIQFIERNSRKHGQQLSIRRARLELRKKFFSVDGPKDWNELQEHVVSSESLDIFKTRLDRHWQHRMFRELS